MPDLRSPRPTAPPSCSIPSPCWNPVTATRWASLSPLTAAANPIAVSNGFRVIRDRLQTGIGPVEQRRSRLDQAVNAVDEAGLPRSEQWLTWDFTTMSEKLLTGGLVSMRDQAFDQLGDAAPAFTVTEVLSTADDGGPLPDGVARRVRGTFEVPSFLTGDGSPGSVLTRYDDKAPLLSGRNYTAEFTCSLTAAQMTGTTPARPASG